MFILITGGISKYSDDLRMHNTVNDETMSLTPFGSVLRVFCSLDNDERT